jgi:hypothetical protein
MAPFVVRELSTATWPDFVDLFSRGNGWDFCSCMAYQWERPPQTGRRPGVMERNREAKRALVEQGRAHGVLVFQDGEPIGWCQFGRGTELRPVGDRRRSPAALSEDERAPWRLSCFVTDRRFRRRGVAGAALRGALEVIRAAGGGLVEGYPVASWAASPGGPGSVEGIGAVPAARGTFGNVSTQGTVSMFRRAGFRPAGVVARTHVLMRRLIA